MVATAIYSVTMVSWKETAFPLCRAVERRWKRNVISQVSSVIVVIRLPISCELNGHLLSIHWFQWHLTFINVAGAVYTVSSVHWNPSLLIRWNVDWKRNVFSCWRNVSSDGEAPIVGGRSFHALAAATGKARSPSVVRRVDGTTSDTVLAERRWRRPSTSAARRRLPAKYDGAVPWRPRNARTHSRNRILSGTHNQWSSRSNGLIYVLISLPRRSAGRRHSSRTAICY